MIKMFQFQFLDDNFEVFISSIHFVQKLTIVLKIDPHENHVGQSSKTNYKHLKPSNTIMMLHVFDGCLLIFK